MGKALLIIVHGNLAILLAVGSRLVREVKETRRFASDTRKVGWAFRIERRHRRLVSNKCSSDILAMVGREHRKQAQARAGISRELRPEAALRGLLRQAMVLR